MNEIYNSGDSAESFLKAMLTLIYDIVFCEEVVHPVICDFFNYFTNYRS